MNANQFTLVSGFSARATLTSPIVVKTVIQIREVAVEVPTVDPHQWIITAPDGSKILNPKDGAADVATKVSRDG
jgi:hypothetical protein